MELDFDKYCVVDRSPTTVLPAPRSGSKLPNRKSSRKSTKNENDALRLHKDFAEISFNRYRSASCRDVRSRRSNLEPNEAVKRGSVYQSSKEVKFHNRTDPVVGRKKIEFSRGSANSTITPFGIIDSLCGSDEEQSTSSDCKNQVYDPVMASEFVGMTRNNGKSSLGRDSVGNLHKSLSAKLSLPHSPARLESEGSKAGSPDVQFTPVKKMFEPFGKSKSHKSPLSFISETVPEPTSGPVGKYSNKTICKSLINDLSDKLTSQSSPAHLHGALKMENRNGVPRFEFSVNSPEDVYVAKAWKMGNALNWVYTFHSLHNSKRKSNASGRGIKDGNKESTLVGQMHVSCYLCTELNGGGSFDESMVTEFVLYDIAQSRRSVSSQDNPGSSPVSDEVSGNFDQNETPAKTKTKSRLGPSPSEPLAAVDLHPELEIAVIVMQLPFEKRESLKFKSGDRKIELAAKEGNSDHSSPGKMHVVIPAGNHSLPSSECLGPSPVLDRWRLGGGCDCGGWDMSCPLNVFGNPNIRISESQALIDEQHPADLFVQGRKDNIPGFSMRKIEDGKYAVDFHAQLSTLQAFSICVSILHTAEASTPIGQERSKQMLQSDSLRVFAEEEIKNLIDVISEEENFKVDKKMVNALPSFMLNPPFSPMSRV